MQQEANDGLAMKKRVGITSDRSVAADDQTVTRRSESRTIS
jgi:hypothetical protein